MELDKGKYGKQFGTMLLAEFVGNPDAENNQFGEGTFLEWARNNKRSWKHDRFRVRVLLAAFRGKALGEISPLAIERLKSARQHSFTKPEKQRSPASVNRELELLSRIFSLAIRLGLADSNPCSRVSKFKLQNQRHRYLLPGLVSMRRSKVWSGTICGPRMARGWVRLDLTPTT